MKKFKLKIIDINGKIEEKEIDSLIAQTPLGEISIWAHHHPLITVINRGKIKIKKDGKLEEVNLITDSLLEFSENEAKLICLSY